MSEFVNLPAGRVVEVQSADQYWAGLAHRMSLAPMGPGDVVKNLEMWETPWTLRRVLWFDRLYSLIREVQGTIHLYGLAWGRDLVLFQLLRAIYEPENPYRTIVGFDTFTGHAGADPDKDGAAEYAQNGAFAVSEGTAEYLMNLVTWHHGFIGGGRIGIVEGDVRTGLPGYLESQPHELVALAYLDLDLYGPTRFVMETLLPRMPTGAILAFDEVNAGMYPGETLALLEVLGRPRVQRFPYSDQSYVVL